MSVPGRIGIILIIALALVDAFILASGARTTANAIETHVLVEPPKSPLAVQPAAREPLLSAAIRQINLFMNPPRRRDPAGV
jgi:hypothetical protein